MERTVSVCTPDGIVLSSLEWSERPPWHVTLGLPGHEPVEGRGDDLFACLMAIRDQVAHSGWKVCVVGARTNAWPSRMSGEMGGSFLVYLHTMGRQAFAEDMVPIFDDAPCDTVGSIIEQRSFRDAWFESLGNET